MDGQAVKAALGDYARALRQASGGLSTPISLVSNEGDALVLMDALHWAADLRPGDESMLDACTGPTLDVGCGPGRLVTELTRRGVAALGIDVSAEAIRQARDRGAAVLLRDVFAEIPGRWRHVLLADGNIGIGGDPVRLLRRCSTLGVTGAHVVVETGPPGSGSWRRQVRLRHDGRVSAMFWWAAVAADDLHLSAAAAGMRIVRMWTEERRWFATLTVA